MARQNLQQTWPEAERAWLKDRAKSLAVTETEYLLALVRREGHRGEEIGLPFDKVVPRQAIACRVGLGVIRLGASVL